jgi:hypothetical protein
MNNISEQELAANMGSRIWRLNNLYWITDKRAKHIKFTPNWAQNDFLNNRWFLNIILKARQLGFTTLMCLLYLDVCLFNSNIRAGIIAHNKEDADAFFRDKIKYAYDHLPESIQQANPAESDRAGMLRFANGSSIRVRTSFRSGTLQYLHVSEFGKICAKHPEKAKEIVTGAFNSVEAGQVISIESTAEGRQGYFYDGCQTAQKQAMSGAPLTLLDFKFHFYPWWKDPSYKLDDTTGVVFTPDDHEYFKKIEAECETTLSNEQRAWYVKKRSTLGPDIKREFPSTPDEAFEQAILGAYFSAEFTKIRERKQITVVPVTDGVPVHTAWDLGMNDTNCIWFFQLIGREVRVVDYYEASGEGLGHYAKMLQDKGYFYGRHFGPHDLSVRELGTGKSRIESAAEKGIKFEVVPRVEAKADSIEAARTMLPTCWFDESRCSTGISRLEHYRKAWNDKLGCYLSHPLHDENSNGADAFQTLAMALPTLTGILEVKARPVVRRKGWA